MALRLLLLWTIEDGEVGVLFVWGVRGVGYMDVLSLQVSGRWMFSKRLFIWASTQREHALVIFGRLSS